jgi:hypothetical protein
MGGGRPGLGEVAGSLVHFDSVNGRRGDVLGNKAGTSN